MHQTDFGQEDEMFDEPMEAADMARRGARHQTRREQRTAHDRQSQRRSKPGSSKHRHERHSTRAHAHAASTSTHQPRGKCGTPAAEEAESLVAEVAMLD